MVKLVIVLMFSTLADLKIYILHICNRNHRKMMPPSWQRKHPWRITNSILRILRLIILISLLTTFIFLSQGILDASRGSLLNLMSLRRSSCFIRCSITGMYPQGRPVRPRSHLTFEIPLPYPHQVGADSAHHRRGRN